MFLQIQGIKKSFGAGDSRVDVLKGLDLDIERGEFCVLLGPSGSGKSTLLNIIGGLDRYDSGDLIINGISTKKYKDRDWDSYRNHTIGFVFQSYNLIPHQTVLANVELALTISGVGKEERRKRAVDALGKVGLGQQLHKKPNQMWGGQMQRVAIARALVNEPEILMLDEPLGALDLKMRKEMQIELKNMHDQLGITFIYVTHDQEEALTMSDKIVVLSEGKIQQIGTPEDIYNEPKNAFVADFIGESNIFKGIMTGHMKVRFCGGEFVGMDDVPEGTLVDVVIRPEDVIITKPEDGTVVGEVTSVIFKGMHYEVAVESGKYEMIIRTTRCYHVGDTVGMQLEPDGIHVMIAEDHTTSFVTTINGDYTLDFNGKIISCDLTQVIPKTKMSDGVLVDENGENVDVSKFRVVVSIQPDDIEMSDDVTAGLVSGKIINLIYKGDHYSYVIRTEYGHDLIVDDEYLWNMDDQVGLIMPEEKMKFQLKK